MTADLPLLIYEGECGFCTASADWVSRRWQRPATAVAWQSLTPVELDRLGLTTEAVRSAAWWVGRNGRMARGHLAVARALIATGGLKRVVGMAMLVPPISWLGAIVYRVVVRFRHRLPGATESCRTDRVGPGANDR